MSILSFGSHVACCASSTAGEKTIHALFHSHNHNDIEVFSPATLLLYLVVYFLLAVLTYGVKVPSGLFVPGIICGSTFGRIVGEIVKSSVYESQHGDTCVGDTKYTMDDGSVYTSCETVRSCKIAYAKAQVCANIPLGAVWCSWFVDKQPHTGVWRADLSHDDDGC